MAVAIAYPDKSLAGRGNSIIIMELAGVASGPLSNARKVLRLTPAQAQMVMSGDIPLAEAYKIAQKVEDESELDREKEQTREKEEAEYARIQREAQGDEDKRMQLMREATATANANYVAEKIAALSIADPELGDAVRTGALTIQQGER